MSLPQRLPLPLMQTQWASQIEPVLNAPIVNGILLQNQVLTSGTNSINHKLGRKLIGWVPVRVRASATLFDTQDSNQTPQLTLQLTASADVVVDIWVF